ncbi:flagellar basal body P-ring formation chaperone FlgA [Allohahella marinimesophila]|uniref:Flagella basal body P-ring formation protein FlgA n=2 Tax=Allohahella marinimesophila TaxID=1054972 RepID=A0ABP7QBV4_9GAMM
MGVTLNVSANTSVEPVWQQQVVAATESFMRAYVRGLKLDAEGERLEYEINSPDARLNYPACRQMPEALASESASRSDSKALHSGGRLVLKISCESPESWTIYTQVRIVHTISVMQARHAIPRGSSVADAELIAVDTDISKLQRGYFRDLESLKGWRSKRTIRAGETLSPGMMLKEKAVGRGDRVVIVASTGGINIRMQGEALSDGTIGQQISVRNLSSERVVRGRVVGRGEVEVML